MTPADLAFLMLLAVTLLFTGYCWGRRDEILSRHRHFLRRHPELRPRRQAHHARPVTAPRSRLLPS